MASFLFSVNSSQTPAAGLTDAIQLATSFVLSHKSFLTQLDIKVIQLLVFLQFVPKPGLQTPSGQGQLLLTPYIP